ncbi:MAG TPA: alpha/beta hydrolase [Thermomicrobiaceae bacterium]|nr:alpha/beta hydrolase [Thermomicrobiaceae bacterium]
MSLRDGGLATDYWCQYYTAEEVAEVRENTTTTMITSGRYPVHVRLWLQPRPAPTVVVGSSVLSYGMHLVRLQAPFFRAGFNVVQFDFPGLGQSGGPRGGCTVSDFLASWRDVLAFAKRRLGEPLYLMGVGEDGVTAYYVGANRPDVAAISVRMLVEYGQPGFVQGQGPEWLVRLKAIGTDLAARLRPSTELDARRLIHWDWVFSGPGDDRAIALLERDPLALRRMQLAMASSILRRHPAPVRFEDCHTPVQVIASTRNRVCPYGVVAANYERLGCPKELVVQEGLGQWQLNREFNDAYCAHVIRWFGEHGAAAHVPETPAGHTVAPAGATR